MLKQKLEDSARAKENNAKIVEESQARLKSENQKLTKGLATVQVESKRNFDGKA